VSDDAVVDALDLEGPAAPPRSNGELVFQAPWESRLFGVTMALLQSRSFDWDEFRELLIDEIGRSDREHRREQPVLPESDDSSGAGNYYACWQAALERLLAAKELCAAAELEDRCSAFAARPAGHDHDHDH